MSNNMLFMEEHKLSAISSIQTTNGPSKSIISFKADKILDLMFWMMIMAMMILLGVVKLQLAP
jgi:hypothetical protein